MERFKSKIGLEFVIPVSLTIISVSLSMASESLLAGLIFFVVFGAFILYLAFNTYYYIANETLIIRCGFFTNKIEIKSIRKISETRGLVSSPALSMDRLEIMYNKFDSILVSPKDKTGFIKVILDNNPEIALKLKANFASH